MIKLSVYILDDEPDAISRIQFLLKKYDLFRIIGTECSPVRAIPIIKSNRPDVLFIDIEMPEFSGFDVLEKIIDESYKPLVIFVTAYDKYAIRAIKKSAFDYLLKPIDRDEMDALIGKLSQIVLREDGVLKRAISSLTTRESEIFDCLRRGKSSREISLILNIAINTVDTHRRRILRKLNLSSTKEILLHFPLSDLHQREA